MQDVLFAMLMTFIVTVFLTFVITTNIQDDRIIGAICREAYKAKLEQQLPTCKEWISGGK